MRQAVVQAVHHTRHRSAFQRRLADQPLMRAVLADLALEAEAALALGLRVARAVDEAGGGPEARAFACIGTAIAKYWVCKRAPGHAFEALECHGGPGYVEDGPMARLYREAPLNSIWEGSGNVLCLDVLRAMARDEDAAPAVLVELDAARSAHPALDRAADALREDLARPEEFEPGARALTERIGADLAGFAARPARAAGRRRRLLRQPAGRALDRRLRDPAARRGHRSHPCPRLARGVIRNRISAVSDWPGPGWEPCRHCRPGLKSEWIPLGTHNALKFLDKWRFS